MGTRVGAASQIDGLMVVLSPAPLAQAPPGSASVYQRVGQWGPEDEVGTHRGVAFGQVDDTLS